MYLSTKYSCPALVITMCVTEESAQRPRGTYKRLAVKAAMKKLQGKKLDVAEHVWSHKVGQNKLAELEGQRKCDKYPRKYRKVCKTCTNM